MSSRFDTIQTPKLAAGLVLTAVGALSVHAIMLQVFGIPFPDLSLIPALVKLLIRCVAMLGLIVLWQLALPAMTGSFVKRWVVLFLIATMLTESLIRGPFMEGYCTTAWVFAFVGNVPKLLGSALNCALIILAAPKLPLAWHKVVAAIVIATFTTFVASPLIGAAMGPVMESMASLAPQSEWCMLPYGANVLIPAYLTFAEPVLACAAAAALVWGRLSPSRLLRFVQFTVLIVAIKNQLLMPFAYAAFAKLPLWDALVSESQFALEAVALAVLTGITWEWSTRVANRPAISCQ